MKTLLASTALALSFAAPVLADAHMSKFVESMETQALRASDLIGARLYVTEQDGELTGDMSTEWDDVGEISDIVIGAGGGIDAVLSDIGGFLGIGERTVAVNMDDLQFVSDGEDADEYFIVLTGSTADLEAAPQFNGEFERGRSQAMVVPAEMEGEAETDMAADAEMETTEADTEMAADSEMAADTEMETEADPEMAADGEMTTESDTAAMEEAPEAEQVEETDTAGTGLDTQSTTSTETVETVDTDLTDAEEPIAGDLDVQEEVVEGETAVEGETVVEGETAMAGNAPMMEREGYVQVANEEMSTEDLTGARVYGVNDEDIGEIGELILNSDNMLDKAIIDVGGFLGLGEKPVAVSMDDLTIMQGEGDIRVYVASTEEQLEEMPAYEE